MNYLYTPKIEFFISGNTNINLPKIMVNKGCSLNIIYSHLLWTPPQESKITPVAIDNSFRLEHMSIEPVLNGLSVHNGQLVVIKKHNLYFQFVPLREADSSDK
jgi:hypothetical protein